MLHNFLKVFSEHSEEKQTELKNYRFFNTLNASFISERGFLPGKNPLHSLPQTSQLNKKLNDIAKNIPELIKNNQLRTEVDKLNSEYFNESIMLEKGNKQQEYIAMLTLLMIAQAYLWENSEAKNVLPAVIAKNLYQISRTQQRFPTLTYADYVLHNWRFIDDKKDIALDNIEPLYTFTDSKDEAWFIKIHVVIESVCSKALLAMCKAFSLIQAMKKDNEKFNDVNETQLAVLLNTMASSLQEANTILQKMKDGCDPQYFFSKLRIYLGGWEKIKITSKDDKEEIGVKFEGVESKDKSITHSYKGPSGAQSSIVPALDAFFGIEHDINGMFKTLLDFQEYMPRKHCGFINFLSKSKLTHLIEETNSDKINDARTKAVHQLELFRAHHIGLVHQYIFNPAAKIGINKQAITGTGGAPINEYLGDRYTSTLHSH